MSTNLAKWVLATWLGLSCVRCVDTASKNNDNTQSVAGTAGTATAGAGAGAAAGGAGASGGPAGAAGVALAGSGGMSGAAGAAAGSGGAGTSGESGSAGTAGMPVAGQSGGAGETAGAGAAGQAGASGAAGQAGAAGAAGQAGASGAAGEAGMPAAGSGGAGSASPAPDPSLVKGTGASCSSYGTPMNGKCGGYYCGVDQATLQKAVDPSAKCGGDVDLLCSNKVVIAVGMCARQIKSAMPLATNDELRPMVQACVFEDAEIKMKTSPECLNCTIDAAACAGDNCLIQCLAGDSAQCDSCRKMNNCEMPVFTCGGLPAPF